MCDITKYELDNRIWNLLLSDDSIAQELSDLVEIGGLIWQRGWAEANAGNVSIRMPDSFSKTTLLRIQEECPDIFSFKYNVSDHYTWFLVSASGSRYREFIKSGFANFVLIGIETNLLIKDEQLKTQIIPANRRPTSEWITHLALHKCLSKERPKERVLLHAHPTDWIVLSSNSEYSNGSIGLMNELYSCLPELNIYFPNGIAFTEFSIPGSAQLADLSVTAIQHTNVIIWEKHGVIISAESVLKAFDYLEVISKAAAVYLRTN